MQLSEENRRALLMAVHQLIEKQAGAYADDVFRGQTTQLDYPPNGDLSAAEATALQSMQGSTIGHTALRKVLASCAAGVIFELLNLFDGTSDPAQGTWSGVLLVDRPAEPEKHEEFLHDAFFDTYWDWRAKRRDSNWHLDNLPE